MERVDKAILEQLPALLDARAILSLSSASDPLATLDVKCLTLPSLVSKVGVSQCLTCVCVIVLVVLQVLWVTLLGGHS